MRFLFPILLIFSVVSCSKNKSVAKDIGGDYTMVKLIKEDGSEHTTNISYHFDQASTDGKTYTNWKSFNPQDSIETTGTYCITGKGVFMVMIRNSQFGPVTDSAKVEDVDKKSMVVRTSAGISFFKKL